MLSRQTKIIDGLLMKYQNCRDSDGDLIIGVLQASGANLTPHQRQLIRTIRFESVRRRRQILQAKGLYPPSPAVAAERRRKGEMIKDTFGGGETDLALELMNKPVPDWMEGIAGVL